MYRSLGLKGIEFEAKESEFNILDDDFESVPVRLLRDEYGMLFWYRRLKTPVCYTDDCYWIDIGIYWSSLGDFVGLEVYDRHLTKTDHEEFSASDYQRLLQTLGNRWPRLREYKVSELVGREVDGVSGATKEEILQETVENAVFTTYKIWNLVHLGEKQQLVDLTIQQLNEDPKLLDLFTRRENADYRYFVLELLEKEGIAQSHSLDQIIWEGIEQKQDLRLRSLSFSVFDRLNLESEGSQERLSKAYPDFSASEKARVLDSLEEVQVYQTLQLVLERDPLRENRWFAERLRAVLD